MSESISKAHMTATDGKGKVVREGKKNPDNSEYKFYWWKAENDDEMAASVESTIKFMQQHQGGRLDQLTSATKLYGTSYASSSLGASFSRSSSVTQNANTRISYNLCASVVDTLQAKMAKNKITPVFCTDGGTWGMQKKSRDLSKFIEGCFYQQDVHRKIAYAFRDAAIWGDGLLYTYHNGENICIERVLPHELVVDMVESLATEPSQLHRVRVMDRDRLLYMFQDDEEKMEFIRSAAPISYQEIGGSATSADLVAVAESWHLKSGPDSDDGLRVMTIGDKLLWKEEWARDYFPFARISYSKEPLGYWGRGACERLQNLQGEINMLMILDQRSRRMMGSFKVLLENGSKVVSQHLNNDVGAIIHYTGTPPQYVVPPPIDASNSEKINDLIAKGYQQEGVSQLSASSVKPMGLDSGKALRAYDDIEADRQLFIGQELETFCLQITRQFVDEAKDVYKSKKSIQVTFPSGRFMETIDWKDIQLDEDKYVLKAFPVSSLADDMSGRLSEVQELAQAGMISPRTARKLMRTPDLEMSDNLANAAEDFICKSIEEIIDNEKYDREEFKPDSTVDLQLAKQLVLQYINYCKFQNAPQKVLNLLRDYSNDVDAAVAGIAPAPSMMPGMGMGAGGPPPANPTATPTSSLIPNVNQGAA